MADFRIAAAQVASTQGDLARNVEKHAAAIAAAAAQGVSVLIFPELSLTGYEPELAERHAIASDDARLAPLSELARRHRLHFAAGAPIAAGNAKPVIGAVLFGPDGSRRTYAKMHLGGHEPDHYSSGGDPLIFGTCGQTIGLAICADSSQPSHPRIYAEMGATVYASGVFLNAEWYATDVPRLAAHAGWHRMLVLMANHGASVGSYDSVGRSAIWSPEGHLLARTEGVDESLIIATRTPDAWCAEVCPI